MVDVKDPITGIEYSFYLEKKLKRYLDNTVKVSLEKNDKDYVMLIDGYEGAGKSTFAQQIGRYVDPTLSLDRICMTVGDFKEAVINAKKNQCVIYDEAVTGMTSGDSISKIGKLLKSMMMQMRQKNLFVIIILPIIFELNKYTVLSRARSFFHVYEKGSRRGYFVGYNRKDTRTIYMKGKKTYSYMVRSRFIGRFYGKYTIDEEEYRLKKEKALFEIDEDDDEYGRNYERDMLIVLWRVHFGLSAKKIVEILEKYDYKALKLGGVNKILVKYKKKYPNLWRNDGNSEKIPESASHIN